MDITRHPYTKGEALKRQDKPEEDLPLPEGGLKQAQEKAVAYTKEFAKAPEGTVLWALTTNKPRTQEAAYIFDKELEIMARETDALIVDLEGKMPDETIKEQIAKAGNRKVILINGPMHPGTASDVDDKQYKKMIEELGSEEEVISQWQSNPEVEERMGVMYDDYAAGYDQMLNDVTRISRDVFPGRQVWVKSFGHSGGITIGLATWARRTSKEFIEETDGKLIENMETARITIKPDGTKTILFRGKEF